MITEFKLFENKENRVFWKINTKMPYFKFALKKVGMDENEMKWWLNYFDEKEEDFDINPNIGMDIILVRRYSPASLLSKEDNEYEWTWAKYDGSYLKEPGRYMGEVNVEDYEIDAEKYNL